MPQTRSLASTALLTLFCVAPMFGAARLTYHTGGNAVPVAWKASLFPIQYSIDRKMADALPGAADLIDKAAREWAAVSDARISFQNLGVAAGAKAGKDGRNSVTLVDDLFANQNFIALTTNWYDDNAQIIEADVQVDATAISGGYNLQQLVEHEFGHLLGLDHSAVLSSMMYPYVGRSGSTSLDSDDKIAIATAYPKNDPGPGSTLEGRVFGDGGGIFAAQVVAVNERGEPVASGLTRENGEFSLAGVPAGNYRIYAEPLDGPVDVRNLSGMWRNAKLVSFPTQFAEGGAIRVENGKLYGNISVNGSGVVRLNPKWLGSSAPGSGSLALGAMPVTIHAGDTVAITVGGDGFTSGMTKLDIPNPSFQRVSDFTWSSNYVSATYKVAADTPPGSTVIMVNSGNESAALTGALRVEAGSTGGSRGRSVRR
ncbi:MAG: matrixin family metalloprotease [Thermoanaerobaculia bacterium]